MPRATHVTPGASTLLDALMSDHCIKNDAALARWLDVDAPVVSKIRHGVLPLGAQRMLTIHEKTGMPIKLMRELLSQVPT